MSSCVRSGFCCKKAPCPYGEWDSKAHQCVFLVPDPNSEHGQYLCGKFDEIQKDPDSWIAPAFGAGCCMSLFNEDRNKILVKLGRK